MQYKTPPTQQRATTGPKFFYDIEIEFDFFPHLFHEIIFRIFGILKMGNFEKKLCEIVRDIVIQICIYITN